MHEYSAGIQPLPALTLVCNATALCTVSLKFQAKTSNPHQFTSLFNYQL